MWVIMDLTLDTRFNTVLYYPYIPDLDVSCIYALCDANESFYIGSTKNLRRRFRWHMNLLRKGKHSNPHLQNHFNKYPNGWYIQIVELCNVEDLLKQEQEHLDFWFGVEVCLNTNPSAILPPSRKGIPNIKVSIAMKGKRAWNKGLRMSVVARKRNSLAHLGKIASNETKLKMSAASSNKPKSAQHRANISKARKGMKFTPEHRANIRAARLKYINDSK
jgi:group I intron endonuclease